ncbi:MAG TPA: palindromic element RPE4 domain-containing protein [Rickettsia endosymbiont of Ceroptres masudai]|nr:palindromic element RPE4 domain-containing protein [Rickettsia endosymbiont of Ceroptres masudai]
MSTVSRKQLANMLIFLLDPVVKPRDDTES